ncbi:interferon alpha-inducible protein 27-like protein 2B [Polyodon spathula]|uniref:interferon alpha-inducible protein 27-like protein 2B n=1 Tax=Polyodon spathula TaxID=7913 RepID=UPI001B7EBFDF|nr:interferon alpha-inducible protein 27-like protein 2B [Polyodon spathula]
MAIWTVLAVAGGAVSTVVLVPVALGAIGFTAGGIAAGSTAAGMMSSAAAASGGGVCCRKSGGCASVCRCCGPVSCRDCSYCGGRGGRGVCRIRNRQQVWKIEESGGN